MFRAIIKEFLADLSAEELMDLFGGPDQVVEMLIEGFKFCSAEQKKALRKALFEE